MCCRMKNNPFKIIAAIAAIFIIVIISLAASSMSDDDMYFILRQKRKKLTQLEHIVRAIRDTVTNTGGTTPATNGTGLNLMLIDELTESYAKDILNCMRKSASGSYDNHAVKLSVGAACGLQNVESGKYPGTNLLKSYLPFENNRVVWNTAKGTATAAEMTLEKYDKTVEVKAGHYGGIDHGNTVTVFQYDTWTSRATVASIDGAGNSGRTTGDKYFYPDVLATNNAYITGFINNYLHYESASQALFSDTWLSFLYAMAHNRGENGALNYLFGCNFTTRQNSRFKLNALSDTQRSDITNSVISLYTDYRAAYPDAYDLADEAIDPSRYTYVAALLAVHNDDWYLSDKMANHLKTKLGECVRLWNKLFEGESIDSATLSSKIDSSVATFADAIKSKTGVTVSSSDCQAVYGSSTDGDEYTSHWSAGYVGCIFKATAIQSEAYTHKYSDGTTPYVIHCMDIICAREAIAACFGDMVYAQMLYYAGEGNVDPTNPDTYYMNSNSYVPTGTASWLSVYGISDSSLSVNRLNELQTAYNIVQLPCCTYASGSGDVNIMDSEFRNKLKPTKLDCSGFVCRVLHDTGFTGFNVRKSTAALITYTSILEPIMPSELAPGDILVRRDSNSGHTMIYLSGYDGNSTSVRCTVMESNTNINQSYNRDGPNIRELSGNMEFAMSTTPQNDGKYYCFRLKDVESAVTRITGY